MAGRSPDAGGGAGPAGGGHRLAPHRRYSAARSRESCVAEEERSLADRAYGGAAGRLVAACVRSGQLGREERAELRRLLDEMEV